jgi:steroid 5-alpha reductase family enzyme
MARSAVDVQSVVTIAGSVVVAGVLAAAGSAGGATVGGVGVFAVCVVLAFAINAVVYVPSLLARTERWYDLTGSVTYLSVVLCALILTGRADMAVQGRSMGIGADGGSMGFAVDGRSLVLAVMVGVWAVRLGSFLFARVRREGSDRRFDRIKGDPLRFGSTWTLQALWVSVTASAAVAAITAPSGGGFGAVVAVGVVVWCAGMAIEVVADAQKSAFRKRSANARRFITTGLWAWSRHPNYFGEIMVWAGVALVALPALSGWRYATLVSPVFVWLLLTRVSGIPLLEARATARWGNDPDYVAYRNATPVLVPRRPTGHGRG